MSFCLGPRTRTPATPDVHPGSFRIGHVRAAPSPPLARYVEHYWVTRWDRRGQPPRVATSFLDPCVHLHVRDGRAELLGVMRGTYRMRIEGIGCVIGVRFRPGGFHPFSRQPVARWTDRTVSAADVFASDADAMAAWSAALWNAVVGCGGDAQAHATVAASHLDAMLETTLGARDPIAEHVVDLVALIAANPALRRVGDLARASGHSERTLQRLFLRHVGVSPAWVIRRYRLHAATQRLTACPRADVQALAFELGYADQAHFIRDFRATLGVTPGAYVKGA